MSNPSSRITELDALRGIAAATVVLFHVTTRYDQLYGHTSALAVTVPWGGAGVYLFFGISGFVILMTLGATMRARDFLMSRFSRLYPTYWAAILVTTLVVAALGMQDLRQGAAVTLANFSMLQGLAKIPDVDGVYWTLLVELCFYACMLLLYLIRALPRIEAVLWVWLSTKLLWWLVPSLSFTLGALVVQRYIPYFAIGMLAYRIWNGERRLWQQLPLLGFSLALIAAVDGALNAVVALVVAAALLGIAHRRLSFLRNGPLAWLGAISYALYLIHENAGWSLIHFSESRGLGATSAVLLAIGCCVLAAWGLTRFVEQPALRLLRQRRRPASPPVATPAISARTSRGRSS